LKNVKPVGTGRNHSMTTERTHLVNILQALFVTFLWSTSFVLVKIGLRDIPAVTFAGLRYSLAALCLLPFLLNRDRMASLRRLSLPDWLRLLGLGIIFYALTQGATFVGLDYLRPATVSLAFSFTPVLVAWLGIAFLGERPTWKQWAGAVLFIIGAVIYLQPGSLDYLPVIGLVVLGIGLIANSASSILGRFVNRTQHLEPVVVTAISMSFGCIPLLAGGLAFQGLPPISPLNWAIVAWLAVVNTAFAFSLWNHTLRSLTAMESSIINNTMLIQIAILAWVCLGDALSWREILGLLLSALGAFIVQMRRKGAAQ
jgi:drug/metabolite transporter (DMT)-like permease